MGISDDYVTNHGICRKPLEMAKLYFSLVHTINENSRPSGQSVENTCVLRFSFTYIFALQSPSDSPEKTRMSYVAKGEKEYDATGAPVPPPPTHKIRITLTSSNVKSLEKCRSFVECMN